MRDRQQEMQASLPKTSDTKHDNTHLIFEYDDGSTQSLLLTHLCRGNRKVRLENLDLSPQSPAWEAASRDFYFDNLEFYNGKSLPTNQQTNP